MHVIGTAGHVDHGKSALIHALTGINPDRLKEEQEREMTIDLGFAWLTLPDGEELGIIDVPGHRDFLENMLAGVGGIDAVIFVIAADEGVMPQTREHLAIVDLLKIKGGVIAITKIDLMEDKELLDLLEEDIRSIVSTTILKDASIIHTSAKSGFGLDELQEELITLMRNTPPKNDIGKPRLPVDRVFSMTGFGTVVTGTLLDGMLNVGQEVEILPKGLKSRIRGLQNHKKKVETAIPGGRTAINLTGMDIAKIRRGDVITIPGMFRTTNLVDVHFQMLNDASKPIKHNDQLKLHIGSSEASVRVRILGVEELRPGQEGLLQLKINHEIVAERGDRYILRLPSPAETLGGGVVLDAHPEKKHKRFASSSTERLNILLSGSNLEVIYQSCLSMGWGTVGDLEAITHTPEEEIIPSIQTLVNEGKIKAISTGSKLENTDIFVPWSEWESISREALEIVNGYYKKYPMHKGISREELKSRLKLPGKVFNAVLSHWMQEDLFHLDNNQVSISDRIISLDEQQELLIDQLMKKFMEAPYTPPAVNECREMVGADLFQYINERGDLIMLSEDVVFQREIYEELVKYVKHHLSQSKTITVSEFRDKFNTSRRYALAFLEYLDKKGVTVREGDFRKLKH